jgi:hypothetical protein
MAATCIVWTGKHACNVWLRFGSLGYVNDLLLRMIRQDGLLGSTFYLPDTTQLKGALLLHSQ